MKKITILLLSFLLVFSSVSFSVAEESQHESSGTLIEERFIGLSRASASLNISSNTAKCKATAYANSSEYYLYVTLSLQKKNHNPNYDEVSHSATLRLQTKGSIHITSVTPSK